MLKEIRANGGTVTCGRTTVARLGTMKIVQVEAKQFTVESDEAMFDPIEWDFRDTRLPLILEVPMRRSTQRFEVAILQQRPFRADARRIELAAPDAVVATTEDMW